MVDGVITTTDALMAATSNRVTETTNGVGTQPRGFTYRAGGDLSQDQHIGGITYTYSYDAQKRLVEVDQNGAKAGTYLYDAFGSRVVRQVMSSNATDHYVFDPDGHLLGDYNGNTGAALKEYVWIDDLPIAVIDSTSGLANTYFIHTGQLNEPLALTNNAKAVVWNAYVNPFGAAQTFSTAQATIDLRLPGQWSEMETNSLSQNGFRDYDPSLGRYVEADPLGIDAGQNVYAYVNGDPLNRSDPLGLDATVTLYGGPTGHLGIQINNGPSYGYYPQNLGPTCVFGGCPGIEKKDNNPDIVDTLTIKSTPIQDALMQSYINGLIKNPGDYTLFQKNCTNRVAQILHAGGFNVPVDVVPATEFIDLERQFSTQSHK